MLFTFFFKFLFKPLLLIEKTEIHFFNCDKGVLTPLFLSNKIIEISKPFCVLKF